MGGESSLCSRNSANDFIHSIMITNCVPYIFQPRVNFCIPLTMDSTIIDSFTAPAICCTAVAAFFLSLPVAI
jgi:hypothetical protein